MIRPALWMVDAEPDFRPAILRKLRELRQRRRIEMEAARAVWSYAGPWERARMLERRARLWKYHPAAIAVERSAKLRALRLGRDRVVSDTIPVPILRIEVTP